MKTGDYALGVMPLVIHVAEALDRVGSDEPALSVVALAKADFNPQRNDVYRVRVNESLKDDWEAKQWMIRFAIFKLGKQVVEDGDGYRLAVPYESLKVGRDRVPRRSIDDPEKVRADRISMAWRYMADKDNIPHYRKGDRVFTVHEKARALDRMPLDKFTELCDSIEANGLRNPIIVHGKEIVDGFNRAAACEAVGVPLAYTMMKGDTSDLGIAKLVFDLNVNRREKPASKAKIALLTFEWFGIAAKEIAESNKAETQGRPKVKPPEDFPAVSDPQFKGKEAAEIAVELAGAQGVISGRSVRDIAAAVENAPETRKKVKSGEITTITAAKESAKKETGTEPEKPKSPSELSKTAWKRLGDAKSCIGLGVKALQEGRVGGTVSKPLELKDWEDRFWETRALLADMEAHVRFLYEDSSE